MKKREVRATAVALVSIGVWAGSAQGQEAEVFALEPLVVTAQKFEDAAQDVPIALSSVSGMQLDRLGVQDLEGFAAFAPNVEIQEQSPNNPGFVIRGITSDSGASNIEPRVSIFQDGVSISKSRGSYVELFDIERVEVLKGPQGTLFGRGAQIGAVHILQNKAGREYSGALSVGYGNEDARTLEAMLNVPVIEDQLSVRFAGVYRARDGYIDNVVGDDLNGKETYAGRLSVGWTPSETTRVDVILNYQVDDYPGTAFKSGTFAPPGGDLSPNSMAGLNRGDELYIKRDVWGLTVLANTQLTDSLSLSSVTGYREFDSHEEFDADGTMAYFLEFAEIAYGEQFSQELRLNYDGDGQFRGFVGVAYFEENGYQAVPLRTDERSAFTVFGANQPLIGPDGNPLIISELNPFTGTPLNTRYEESFTNYGDNAAIEAFVDGTYKISERFEVTAGLRFTYEDIESAYLIENNPTPFFSGAPGFLLPASNGRVEASDSFTSVVGRLIGVYHINQDANLYASISRGRRPNVINVDNDGSEILNDEIVISYEIGYKALLNEGRVSIDASVFKYDYESFQTSVLEVDGSGTLIAQTRDDGNATAYGAEAQLQVQVSGQLYAFASIGWLDATFDDTDSDGNAQALAGNRFRLSPEYSAAIGFSYEVALSNSGVVYVAPNYTWKSQLYFEEANQPGIEQDDYGLLNLRAGYRWEGGRYEIAAFASNLLDEGYIIDAGNTGGSFGIPTFIGGPPRLFGVEIRARF